MGAEQLPRACRSALEEAAALSERMRVAARRGDWAGVAQLQQRRRPLLAAALEPASPSAPAARALRPTLERIALINREITAAAAAARDGLRRRLLGTRQGHRALTAYRDGA